MIENYNNYYQRDLSNKTLFSPQEGFIRGNMFKNLYNQYKNYTPQNLTANNNQDALFLKMAEAEFAAHDLNLYLDLYPQDGNMLELFNQYRKLSNELTMEYEDSYGPILISSNSLNTSPFLWQTERFPWNEGGM